jgi:hypothetical protein
MSPAEVHTALESGIGLHEPPADTTAAATVATATTTATTTTTLFLDFDGVLHPEYCHPDRFFEALPLLATVLLPRPWVEVVVSSNWRYERVDASATDSTPHLINHTTNHPTSQPTVRPTNVWRLKPMEMVHDWLQAEPLVANRVVGINPLMPDRSLLPDRVLAYEREAQCLAWLRAWRPSRIHWLALDDRPWLFSPFCPHLFETDGTRGLQPEQLPALAARLDAMRI